MVGMTSGGRRGFWRIFEAVLMILLLFGAITEIVKITPPLIESRDNVKILNRYAEDFRDMTCGSSIDRARMMNNVDLDAVNSSLDYFRSSSAPDLRYRVVVYNAYTDAEITTTGYAFPDIANRTSSYEVGSSGCLIAGEGGQDIRRRVIVQTWYSKE